METFSYMPLSCLIDENILCVHGGLGPSCFSLSQIARISRPIDDFGDDLIDSVLWSDPNPDISRFEPSLRGTGYCFGEEAIEEFMSQNELRLIIRGHECVPNGIQWIFNRRVVTVFGASNYCGIMGNNAGVLVIEPSNVYKEYIMGSLPFLIREQVVAKKVLTKKRVDNQEAKTARGGERPCGSGLAVEGKMKRRLSWIGSSKMTPI
jgi:protein phosphatase